MPHMLIQKREAPNLWHNNFELFGKFDSYTWCLLDIKYMAEIVF